MQLLSTIRLPQNLKLLSDRLPKSKYDETHQREIISTSLILSDHSNQGGTNSILDPGVLSHGLQSARALNKYTTEDQQPRPPLMKN
jgi:hypothetical protein